MDGKQRETIHIPHLKWITDQTGQIKNKRIKFQTRCQRINHAQIDAMIATDQGTAHIHSHTHTYTGI